MILKPVSISHKLKLIMIFSVLQSEPACSLSTILSSPTFDVPDLSFCTRDCHNCLLYDTESVVTLQQIRNPAILSSCKWLWHNPSNCLTNIIQPGLMISNTHCFSPNYFKSIRSWVPYSNMGTIIQVSYNEASVLEFRTFLESGAKKIFPMMGKRRCILLPVWHKWKG